jgi:SAM-dependent methyltransferase
VQPLTSIDPPGAGPLEATACPLCGAAAGATVLRRFPPYEVRRCGCGMTFLSPRLSEAVMRGDYERLDYFEGGGTGYLNYGAQEATLRSTFRGLLRGMRRRGLTGGRLLEVGCAYGFFLDEARGHFSHRVGTDYSAAALERARGRADVLLLGGPADVRADEPFDCAACIHVVEHVYDPVPWLMEIRDLLAPGGWLVLATPDAGAFWRPLLGRRWPFYKVPEHVSFFDRVSLARLLAAAGLVEAISLPYPSVFPLGLAADKLGLPLPAAVRSLPLWLPAATVCLAARRPRGVAAGSASGH